MYDQKDRVCKKSLFLESIQVLNRVHSSFSKMFHGYREKLYSLFEFKFLCIDPVVADECSITSSPDTISGICSICRFQGEALPPWPI